MTLLSRPAPVTAADAGVRGVQLRGPDPRRQGGAIHPARQLSKSIVVEVPPGDIKDVLVADPLIANAVVRKRPAGLHHRGEGWANQHLFFDAEGRQLMAFDIAVTAISTGFGTRDCKRGIAEADVLGSKASPMASC